MGRVSESAGKYAVLDFETTGKSPSLDRVIEIGLVILDENLFEVEAFNTLLHVNRDVGPTYIHGLRPAHLKDAPTFEQVAPRLLALISDKIIVAHNARFDLSFLVAELKRIGIEVEISDFGFFCTRYGASSFGNFANDRLETVASALGIRSDSAHEALADARTTAEVLRNFWAINTALFKSLDPGLDFTGVLGEPEETITLTRQDVASSREYTFVQRLIMAVNGLQGTGEENEYSALLEKYFFDALLTDSEADHLVQSAVSSGLTSSQIQSIHNRYFSAWVAAAWDDGELSTSEETDLRYIGGKLGISEFEVEGSLIGPPAAGAINPVHQFELREGDVVVLTGDMVPSKSEISHMLQSLGMVLADNVSKKTKLVVAADPESESGKAKKARDYGIRICGTDWICSFYESRVSD